MSLCFTLFTSVECIHRGSYTGRSSECLTSALVHEGDIINRMWYRVHVSVAEKKHWEPLLLLSRTCSVQISMQFSPLRHEKRDVGVVHPATTSACDSEAWNSACLLYNNKNDQLFSYQSITRLQNDIHVGRHFNVARHSFDMNSFRCVHTERASRRLQPKRKKHPSLMETAIIHIVFLCFY